MKDEKKTKEQLLNELKDLRQKIADSKKSENKWKHVKKEIKHLNLVLRAIRKVNQLIVKEKDTGRLIQSACDNLIENRGYYNSWIALFDESGKFVTTAKSGFGKDFSLMFKMLRSGKLPECAQKAMKKPGTVIIENSIKSCKDCPLVEEHAGRNAMVIRLEHGGNVYGILSVSILADFSNFKEEQGLFEEVAGDIAFALHDMELEEKRNEAQKALMESEERYRSVFETTGTATVIIEEDTTISMANTQFEELSGYTREEIEGKMSWTDFVVKDDLERMKKYHYERRKKGWKAPKQYEFHFIDKNKNIKDILLTVDVISGKKKSVASLLDITDRKKAQESLQESEEMFRAIGASAQDVIIMMDNEGNISYWNKAAERIFGYKREEVFGSGLHELITPERYYDAYKKGFIGFKKTGQGAVIGKTLELSAIRKNGEEFPMELSLSSVKIKGKWNAIGIIRDITERKKTEDEIKQYQLIVESAHDAIFFKDLKSRYIIANNKTLESFGLSREKVIGKNDYEIMSNKKEAEKNIEDDKLVFKTGETREIVKHLTGADGKEYWFHAVKVPKLDNKGEISGLIGIARDISEQKLANEKIKEYSENLEGMVKERTKELNRALYDTEEARDRIDNILKAVADGLIVTDRYNRIILMNSAAENLLGVRFSEVIDRPINFAIKEKTLCEKFVNTFNKKENSYKFDFRLPGDDPKNSRIMNARTSIIYNKEGGETGIVTIIHDVTHEREVDRMKTEFISTAAHELRTPLTSIIGFSDILANRGDISEEERKRFLSYINKQGIHLANIVSDMLDISRIESGRGLELNKAMCDVREVIEDVIPYFQGITLKHEFLVDLPDEPVELSIDREKIEQLVKNILGNAVKYSPDGGVISEAGEIIEDNFEVSIEDHGIGMTSEQVEKIFDKFYRVDTSGTATEGTGLGMVIVKYIVEAHGGKVWVESEFGKGTTVRFTIPMKSKK